MANEIEEYLYRTADVHRIPLGGALEISPLCNLNCKMCYIRHTGKEVERKGGLRPLQFWLDLIPDMQKAGTLFVNLIGGEPLVYPHIGDLYTALYQGGFKITITTNGIMLSDQVPEWMIRRKPRYVAISVYGGTNETYWAVCGIKGGYDRIRSAIANLKSAGIEVRLKSCLTPDNAEEQQKLFELAEEYGLSLEMTTYNYPPVRKEKEEKPGERLTPAEAARYELKIKQFSDPDQYRQLCTYLACDEFAMNTDKHKAKFTCRGGTSTFWINWKGYLTPCGMLEDLCVDLTEYNFGEAWKKIVDKTEAVQTCQECAECVRREVCFVCPAMMKAETGAYTGKPQYVCDVLDEMIQISKEQVQKM